MTTERLSLVGVSGPLAGKSWSIGQRTVRLGRDAACEIHVDDSAASRHHAEIVAEAGAIEIRDLGSTNHTFVNDAQISSARLQAGDVVRIGSAEFRVDAVASARPEPVAGSDQRAEPPRGGAQPRRQQVIMPDGPAAEHAGAAASSALGLPAARLVVPMLLAVVAVAAAFWWLTRPAGLPPSGEELRERRATASVPESVGQAAARPQFVPEVAFVAFDEGRALAQFGRLADARTRVAEAVRLAPDWREASLFQERLERRIEARIDTLLSDAQTAKRAFRNSQARLYLEEVLQLASPDDPREATARELLASLEEDAG